MALRVEVRARVPFRLHPCSRTEAEAEIVSFNHLPSGAEHLAVVLGRPTKGCLVRIHSECLTGDVFGSSRCDCGAQLMESIERISARGGVVLYMRQEGRGIGLYNKLDAYLAQDAGADTFSANEQLGFGADERQYDECAEMLIALGLDSVELLTNNPRKVESLIAAGIDVESVQHTGAHVTPENAAYLREKALLAGHNISIDRESV